MINAFIDVLAGAKPSAFPDFEPASGPICWLQGVDKCLRRMLISAGELVRNEIVYHGKRVEAGKWIQDVSFLDILVRVEPLGSLTPTILNWLKERRTR